MSDAQDRFLEVQLTSVTAPELSEHFDEQLWEAIERRQRQASSRWRLSAIILAIATVAAAYSASVFALRQADRNLDRSVVCTVPIKGGIPVFQLSASTGVARANVNGALRPVPGLLWLGTDPSMQHALVAFQSAKAGYLLDQEACGNGPRIALSPGPLGVYETFRKGDPGTLRVRCYSSSEIRIRAKASFARSGVPLSVKLAVETVTKPRLLAYVDWTPARISTYLARSECFDR
jgi:hypothetical protein